MSEEMQVIELAQLPVIVERLQSVKATIEEKTKAATSLVCTEATYKSVKQARAELNSEYKLLEAQRLAVKKQIMAPYEAFEKVYAECVRAPFGKADIELKEKIDDVTNGLLGEKCAEVMTYYNELVEATGIKWMAELEYRPKVTMGASMKSLKSAAADFVKGVAADVEMINGLPDSSEVMVEYRKCLDATAAIKTVNDRHAALAEQTRLDEERRVRDAERAAARAKAEEDARNAAALIQPAAPIGSDPEAEPAEEVPEEVPEEVKTYMTKFWAKASIEKLRGLKDYLERNGIEYGKL